MLSIFLSLTLFCATLPAQQADYYQATAPADASDALAAGSVGQGIAAGPVCADACGDCATSCDCCEPWRLFPQCDGGLNFWGWLNAGFVGNTSSPASKFNGPYNAVDRANELMFNQMYFIAEKGLPCDCCCGIGGRVDVIYGEDYFLAQSVGLENHDDGSPHWNSEYYGWAIPQAYVEVGRTDLSLKLGHFYSPVGYEGLPAYTQARTPRAAGNFFYTKAYSYQFAGPFTHWGAIATWKPSDYWETQFGLTNGWDTLDRETQDNLNIAGLRQILGRLGLVDFIRDRDGRRHQQPGRPRRSRMPSRIAPAIAGYFRSPWAATRSTSSISGWVRRTRVRSTAARRIGTGSTSTFTTASTIAGKRACDSNGSAMKTARASASTAPAIPTRCPSSATSTRFRPASIGCRPPT